MKILNSILTISFFVLLQTNHSTAQKNIPAINKTIISYVESVIGKQVDRGECWDLANQALIKVNANWDGQYKYGKRIFPQKDTIFPGDIIQFENVIIKYQKGNTIYTEKMKHHTAIVYNVLGKGYYEIAHQNTQFSGHKVGISELKLSTITNGKIYFYRPVPTKKIEELPKQTILLKNIPSINKTIISYVETVIGKKVDRGECWDLANQALIKVNANWDGQYKYGKRIFPQKDTIFPGDIIQFENVIIKYQKGNTIYTEKMKHHTAIVYNVLGKGYYEIAHQNTQFSGHKVGISELKLSNITNGKIYFYRPFTKE